MTSTERRFIASALGAMVGFAAAFYLHPMMWWVGAALGGVVAWVVFDPASIFRAIPIAARAGLRAAPRLARILVPGFWVIALVGMIFLTPAFYFFSNIIALDYFYAPDRGTAPPILMTSMVALVVLAVLVNFFIVEFRHGSSVGPPIEDSVKRSIFLLSPFGHLYLLGLVMRKVPAAVRKVPAAAREVMVFLRTFLVTLYMLTHSRERVLIAMDAMIGVAFGYLVLFRMVHVEMLLALFITSLVAGVLGIAHYKLSETFVMPHLVSKNGI